MQGNILKISNSLVIKLDNSEDCVKMCTKEDKL